MSIIIKVCCNKNLLNDNEVDRFIKISKRYEGLQGPTLILIFSKFYKIYRSQNLYKISNIDLNFLLDSFFLISRVKKKNWSNMIKSLERQILIKFLEQIHTHQKKLMKALPYGILINLMGATHLLNFLGAAKSQQKI